jgi:hypothetical protein
MRPGGRPGLGGAASEDEFRRQWWGRAATSGQIKTEGTSWAGGFQGMIARRRCDKPERRAAGHGSHDAHEMEDCESCNHESRARPWPFRAR